jgi:A/G-specific adenine glycosylase
LAASPASQVLSLWQGLGYNRRALYLKEIAGIVVDKYGGKLPRNIDRLDSFPGIGAATASSIAAFAFNIPTVFIETNIRRVFIHHFFREKSEVHDREILPLVEAALDVNNPREWYYALMDYGSNLVRIVENPNRKSRHYVVQSPFEGSNRQTRGVILKLLLTGRMTCGSLSLQSGVAKATTQGVLKELMREGFVSFKKGYYSIQEKR